MEVEVLKVAPFDERRPVYEIRGTDDEREIIDLVMAVVPETCHGRDLDWIRAEPQSRDRWRVAVGYADSSPVAETV